MKATLLVLGVLSAPASLSAPPRQQDAVPAEAPAAVPVELGELLEPIRARRSVPALGAAVLRDGRLVALGATGARSAGRDEAVSAQDLWHLGSCGKAMTATVCARLVERGLLAWDTTVGEALGEAVEEIDAGWKPVTLEQLLAHRGGAPGELDPPRWAQLWKREGTPGDQRLLLARLVLTQPPQHPPGERFEYSNQSYALAGLMAERAADLAWEELVERELFAPLGMDAAGFGPPASGADPLEQPLGHKTLGGALVPVVPGPLEPADNPAGISPAGTLHASLASWGRFAALHLGEGELPDGTRYLRAETVRRLHEPPPGQDYALGWKVVYRPWAGGQALTHAGSNTMWHAVAWLAPQRGLGVLVTCNAGGDAAVRACDDAAALLIGLYQTGGLPREEYREQR